MDDMSVFRRFFVASDMIREILTQGGLRQPSFSGEKVSPPTSNGSDIPEDQSIPPHLGGFSPISGTKPTSTARRTNTRQRDSAATDKYKFPS
jgi:hypothetical protein